MIDAHQHFWAVDRGDYGWLTPDLIALYRDLGPADLALALQAAGITRTIPIQAAETEAETDHLLAIAARTAFVAGVVGWTDMLSPAFPARLAHYRAQPKWVGLRPMLQEHPPELLLDPRFRAALAEVTRLDATNRSSILRACCWARSSARRRSRASSRPTPAASTMSPDGGTVERRRCRTGSPGATPTMTGHATSVPSATATARQALALVGEH